MDQNNNNFNNQNNNDYTNPDVGYNRENVSIILCEECEDFFKNHTLIDTIYYFYTK